MIVLILCLVGVVVFAGAAVSMGAWLGRHPSRENAERSSRVIHLLFFLLLNLPPLALFVYPGITRLDGVAGLPPLEPRLVWAVAGLVLAIPGLYLLAVTNKALRKFGNGANAFRLTKQVVNADVYGMTRNPMSLGFYLWITAVGLMAGSTTFTLVALLGLIPSHLLCLVFFEARELSLRLGPSYDEYRRQTPFLFPRRPGRRADHV